MTVHSYFTQRHFDHIWEADFAVSEAKRMKLKALTIINPKTNKYEVYFWERHIDKNSNSNYTNPKR